MPSIFVMDSSLPSRNMRDALMSSSTRWHSVEECPLRQRRESCSTIKRHSMIPSSRMCVESVHTLLADATFLPPTAISVGRISPVANNSDKRRHQFFEDAGIVPTEDMIPTDEEDEESDSDGQDWA